MTNTIVVTGTDTDVGKTIFAAALAGILRADYWKPIQSGLDGGGDASTVARLGVPADRILPEAYRLKTPCSPHLSAEIDGLEIDAERLSLPPTSNPLVIEGAGGALVPLTRDLLHADLFARWSRPVIIVASTRLGTINHSLLTIEALRSRGARILGVAFVGDVAEHSEATIARIGGVRRLGRLPWLSVLDGSTLKRAFAASFDIGDFR